MRRRFPLPIVTLAILLAAGCSKAPNDAAITTSVKAQMFSDAQLKDASLNVVSSKGQVTISGTVSSDAARLDAYKIASQTAGVSKVIDEMIVNAPQAAAAAATVPPAPAPAPAPEKRTAENARPHRVHKPKDVEPAPAAEPPADADALAAEQASQQSASQTNEGPPAPQPAPVAPPPPPPPPPPQPVPVTIAAGSTLTIRMIDGVDSKVNNPGEIFHASLDAPLVAGDRVVVPKGSDIYVRLANAASAGRMSGKSELRLELVKLEFQGRSYPLASSTYEVAGSSRGANTAKKVGAGAVLGTLLGAIAGGGKGAAIGAAAGAGGGAVWNGVTLGQQVRIPSETKLDFQLDQPVTVTVMPKFTPPAPPTQTPPPSSN